MAVSELGIPGLLRPLRRVSKFQSPTLSYQDVVARNALFRTATPEQRLVLLEVQKNWHRPSYSFDTLKANILKYGSPRPPRCLRGDYLAILKTTLDEFRPPEPIIPLSSGHVIQHPDFPRDTSPGLPYCFEKGIKSKRDVIERYGSSVSQKLWDMIGRGKAITLPDCMAYHRVVASEKTKSKVRPVWGYPFDVLVEEMRWFLPLIDHVKRISNEEDLGYGLGLETALDGHQHIRRAFACIPDALVLNADYSNFDANVPHWLIRDVVAHMSSWFDFSKVRSSDGKIWPVNEQRTARRWKAMWSYFIKTKVRLPNGERYQKFHGVPSGSAFTNMIDTFCNMVQTRTALYMTGNIPKKDYYYGDDCTILLSSDRPLDLKNLSDVLLEVFGAEMHPDKTLLSDNPDNIHWLGYFARPEGPRRSGEFILASTMFPDREVASPLESAARLLGQLHSCMDPYAAVWFYDAVQHIREVYQLSNEQIESQVRQGHSKSMKYLVTLGLSVTDIVVPVVTKDLQGRRFVESIRPKPTSRRGPFLNCFSLPSRIFVPECYQHPVFRRAPLISSYDDLCSFVGMHDYSEWVRAELHLRDSPYLV